jgi:hypothetical protein
MKRLPVTVPTAPRNLMVGDIFKDYRKEGERQGDCGTFIFINLRISAGPLS